MDFAREDIRCAKHEEGSLEAELCHQTAEDNFEKCVRTDGCVQVFPRLINYYIIKKINYIRNYFL